MSDNERSDITERITRLEVSMSEKWLSHDKRADERWTDLMDKFHEFDRKLDNRTCNAHGELLTTAHHRIVAIEKWQNTINWAIGVVYIAVVGALIKISVG